MEGPHEGDQREEGEEEVDEDADHDGEEAAGAERQRAEEILGKGGEKAVVADQENRDKELLHDVVRIEKDGRDEQQKDVDPVADLPGRFVKGGGEEQVQKQRQHVGRAGNDQAGHHPEASVQNGEKKQSVAQKNDGKAEHGAFSLS